MARSKRPFPTGKFRVIKQRSKNNPKSAVFIEYTWDSIPYRISTGLSIIESEWNPKENKGLGGLRASWGNDYRRKNNELASMIAKYDRAFEEFSIKHPNSITKDVILAIIHNKPITRQDKGIDLSEYIKKVLKSELERNVIGRSRYQNGLSAVRMFEEYLVSTNRGTYKNDGIYLGEITTELIDGYISWKKEVKKNTDATINHNLTPIIKGCKEAASEGLIDFSLYGRIQKLRIEEKVSLENDEERFEEGKSLSKEQLQKLSDYCKICPEKRRKEFIEMYLFAFHACGLRVVDVMSLQWKHIDFQKKELRKILIKVGKRHIIPLSPGAIDILTKWKSKRPNSRFVFDLVQEDLNLDDSRAFYNARNNATKCINQSLKVVGELLEFPNTLTMHTARHTFAVFALNDGLSMSVVSRMLGHATTATTEKVYAQFLPDTLKGEMEKLKYDYSID